MANFCELVPEEFEPWVASRPKVIQRMVATHPPNKLYRMASTGQRVTIYSYAENETVTVSVTGRFNFIIDFERQVFGIPLSDLTECDLPGPDEKLGVLLSQEAQEELLEKIKAEYQKQNEQ